jgi:D-aminopeptidase
MRDSKRPRAREIGLVPGTLSPGVLNSITDVTGVKVGHDTLIIGDDIRTGVTAILPHEGNLFQEKVPGAVFVGNGFGKLAGSTQVNELGEIETPILLTNTMCVPRAADALIDYMFSLSGNENVTSVNPVVGETNDGYLNNIRNRRVGSDEVFYAIEHAASSMVEEGCVGAGTGTRALGFKGGIGSSSRILPQKGPKEYTIGVLVQTNYGGLLTINGAPVGRELQKTTPSNLAVQNSGSARALGSVMIIVATDAPLGYRNLYRLATRPLIGLGRTGSTLQNHSGDYIIAFSTALESRLESTPSRVHLVEELRNDEMDPLFMGAVEATEEAVYNSLFRATTMKGMNDHVVEALPTEETREILQRYNAL